MTRFLCALLFVGWTLSAANAAEPGWQAGFASAPITPPQLMWMSGYAGRTSPATGKETDLWAKAMVLRDAQGHRLVLVTLDLVGIDRSLSLKIREAIGKKHQLSLQGIALSVSHTHCGPVVGHNLGAMYFLEPAQAKLVEDYTVFLSNTIQKVVDEAVSRLEPVTVTQGLGHAGFAVNRRENKEVDVPKIRAAGQLKGPIDHDVPVIAVRNAQGELKGIVFGYACHATVLPYLKWCGDYPGFAMIELEKMFPGATAMFFAGCGADQNPLPRRTVELAQEYGKRLASAVNEVVVAPMTPIAPTCGGLYSEIPLPLGTLPTQEQLEKDSKAADKYVALRAKNLLKEIAEQGKLATEYRYPVQTWQLGHDLSLVILGGEVVVDYARRIRGELEPKQTWVMAYANDVMAYIPSKRVLKEGGYEGASSMIYYGLPTTWSERAEDILVEEVRRQVKQLRREFAAKP